MPRHAVIGEHFYNPPREASHTRLQKLHSDPQGINWNEIIALQVYLPQLSQHILRSASFDMFRTTQVETIPHGSSEEKELKEAKKDRGVGDPILHLLMPDQTQRDKSILIHAGREAFEHETGVGPQWFWAPETALDIETLTVLYEAGYRGAICAPEQVQVANHQADNLPVKIKLPGGQTFILLPFDRPVSSDLAFQDKSNADDFVWRSVAPRLDQLQRRSHTAPLVAWTDGETFGHHAKWGDLFLKHLLEQSLPSTGIAVIGINQLPEVWDTSDYVPGKLRERSAWSCPHGNLVRWHGACPCDGGYNGRWKEPFFYAVQHLNQQITNIVDQELSPGWDRQLSHEFQAAFYYPGGKNSTSSLLAAKASALGANISCGTFFDNPQTSGRINMLFARQTLEHLGDAGHTRAALELQKEFITTLHHGVDPHTGLHLDELFQDILLPLSA